MIVFSKEKFIEIMGENVYELISRNDDFNWVDRAEGKKVEKGFVEIMRRKFSSAFKMV